MQYSQADVPRFYVMKVKEYCIDLKDAVIYMVVFQPETQVSLLSQEQLRYEDVCLSSYHFVSYAVHKQPMRSSQKSNQALTHLGGGNTEEV